MVFLDVVYNHFGPKGNYLRALRAAVLHRAAPDAVGRGDRLLEPTRCASTSSTTRSTGSRSTTSTACASTRCTPSSTSRRATSSTRSRGGARRDPDRDKHLVLENDANQARFLGPGRYNAQWNDDSHHALPRARHRRVGRLLRRLRRRAGEAPRALPRRRLRLPGRGLAVQQASRAASRARTCRRRCFVDFLQNHDQIGNRAFGERLHVARRRDEAESVAAPSCCSRRRCRCSSWARSGAAAQPFLFFCDFDGELGEAVRKGRREEFARFAAFASKARAIPDPLAESTFRRCVLRLEGRAQHARPAGSRTTGSCCSCARRDRAAASSAPAATACSASAPSR